MTSNPEAAVNARPTPAQIDALVRKIDQLTEKQKPTAKQQEAAKECTDLRAQLIGWTQEFGEVPKSAPSSKRLHGKTVVLTVTTGTYSKENPEAVIELRDTMKRRKHSALFAQLFTPTTSYDRAKDALNNLKNADLPDKLRLLYQSIFERTSTSAPRAPSLRIDKAA